MDCGLTCATKAKKSYPETDESGTFWISTILDMDSRLRVAHGIDKDETKSSENAFRRLQERGHPEEPPPLISDGWGGIDDALIKVYGKVPEYAGQGRPPTRPQPARDWQYLQMIKHRDERGHLTNIELKAVWGKLGELIALLGKSTAYVERSNLTTRLFNGRLTRKTLAFSKDLENHQAAVIWEDAYYNLVRPHKSLRLRTSAESHSKWIPRTPAMVAGLTDHIWTVKELLMTVVVPKNSNTC
jgi:hypothetical protein